MDEQNKNLKQNSDGDDSNNENQSGNPGRTPGKAEGSRKIVEEDLKQKDERRK
jgi:hypothetical protein